MNHYAWIALATAALATVASALHFALRDFSLRKLELIAKSNGGLRKLRPVLDDPDAHALSLGAVRVLLHVATVTLILLAAASHAAPDDPGLAVRWSPAALAVAAVAAALALYLFGLLIPISLARHAGERLIHSCALLIRAVHILAAPLRPLSFVDEAVRRLVGAADVTEKQELEEELLDAVIEVERGGSLAETERKMIESVVAMGSTTVEEIMTPRTEIEGLELTDDILHIRTFIDEAGHSRIPVWTDNPDHILGILYAKDLLQFLGEDTTAFQLKPVLRKALFVPESKPVNELLIELQAKKVHMAIVLDEYGGTTGLVTLEDVVEEIVGEIEDEYEPADETPPVISVDHESRTAEIEARAYIRDVNEALEAIDLELPENEDYDTLGGYVLSVLGHIPEVGESFHRTTHAVRVLDAEPTRVNRLLIERLEPQPEDDDDRRERRSDSRDLPPDAEHDPRPAAPSPAPPPVPEHADPDRPRD